MLTNGTQLKRSTLARRASFEVALFLITRIFRILHPGGMTEGSRGLSAATPPVDVRLQLPTLEGSQIGARSGCDPSGVGLIPDAFTGGVAALNPRLPSVTPAGVDHDIVLQTLDFH